MPNISGHDIKREIIKSRLKGEECKALVAGFVRACMALSVSRGGGWTLQLDCQSSEVREYVAEAILRLYKVSPRTGETALLYPDCEKLLRLMGVFTGDDDGVEIADSPSSLSHIWAYLRGVFLGCGSFSARDTDVGEQKGGGGYHLEFSVISESFADALLTLLGEHEIFYRKMVRADKFVVYAKDSENVCNCLALMRLGKFVLKLNDTVAALSVKKAVNRRTNCDIANMTRTANAAGDVLDAIERIRDKHGLDTLQPKLLEAAEARLNSPEASLAELAYELGISKSGLKHRFDRISAIATDLAGSRSDAKETK